MLTSEQVRATIEAYVDGWAKSDRVAWGALFADDAVLVDPVGKPAHVGKAAVVAFFDGVQDMPFKFTPRVHRIAVCGHEALLLFRMEAVGADGNGMYVEVADIFELDATTGKIKSLKAYWDKGCRGTLSANAAAG
jgi:steroid Delta-isomerase